SCTVTAYPSASRLAAIAPPMLPTPMTPKRAPLTAASRGADELQRVVVEQRLGRDPPQLERLRARGDRRLARDPDVEARAAVVERRAQGRVRGGPELGQVERVFRPLVGV